MKNDGKIWVERLLLLFVLVVMGVTPIGITSNAEECSYYTYKAEEGNYECCIIKDSIQITKYIGEARKIQIPEKIEGKKVTSIGLEAFYSCEKLVSVIIPDGVTSIEGDAFAHCINLSSIVIPQSVSDIASSAFDDTQWIKRKKEQSPLIIINNILVNGEGAEGNIEIPEEVVNIGNFAFSGCNSLIGVTLPEGLQCIGAGAFSGCNSLISVSIPKSVTDIGESAFNDTPWLKRRKEESSLVIINNLLIDGEDAKGNIVIPKGVTSIVKWAFSQCTGVTSVTIPEGVISIDNMK